ncbi:HIT family protein [Candidatus Woesebacteria bacterium]|nr:HIT family protein [Candidatus Woesebacteria bacterium]
MHNHVSSDYICPICLGVAGVESEDTLMRLTDIVYIDEFVTAFINSFWIKNNPGHVIVVPNDHYENLYDLPTDLGAHIFRVAKKVAIAMKEAYRCDGITTLQNNEPAGGQHAFHYHHHIFPRYENDDLHENMSNKQLADPTIRKEYADKLRSSLQGETS